MCIAKKYKTFFLIYLLPPLIFQVLVTRWDIGNVYWRKDTGLVALDFYQNRNYIPVTYQLEDRINQEFEIDAVNFIGDLGREILSYEICFNKITTIRDNPPTEEDFPFKDFKRVQMEVPIGLQSEQAAVTLVDETGRDAIRIEDDSCADVPGGLLNYKGKLQLHYFRNHFYHREFFDQLKKDNSVVEYRPDPEFGLRFGAALTEDIRLTVKPKQIWMWRGILYAVFVSAWIGFIQLVKTAFRDRANP